MVAVNVGGLQELVVEALKAHNGQAGIVEVCKHIWANHENELRQSGDLFFTWQYDVRWAANQLRRNGALRAAEASPRGIWELI